MSVLVLTCEVYESVVVEPHEVAPRHVREVTQIGSAVGERVAGGGGNGGQQDGIMSGHDRVL